MDKYDLNSEYEWFSKNLEKLFKKYPEKFLIVSGNEIIGAFDTFDQALEEALKIRCAGEFLIQQCVKKLEPIQYYNRAVIF